MNIVSTLEMHSMLQDYVRHLYSWQTDFPNSLEVIELKSLTLIGEKDIDGFILKLNFICDWSIYNDKWKGILNEFREWHRAEYKSRYDSDYVVSESKFESVEDLGWNLENVKREQWKPNMKILAALQKEIW